ncbi:MAG: hypothetical protein M0Q96_01740 [Candidatus Omnitrophica bacterium]|jgi:biopolymer transport protein ExbB/TolQ|nr:hypothetical protein [Candidatus Omnitrophota bacterium]
MSQLKILSKIDQGIKDKALTVLSILTLIFCLGWLGSCTNISRNKSAWKVEMSKRLDLEERMTKFSQEKSALEEKAKAKANELEVEQAANQATKKALIEEQLINASLKEELQKVSKLKENLEQDLKGALAGKKPKK